MATNTIIKAQKEVINDAVKELVSAPVFTGTTSYSSGGGGDGGDGGGGDGTQAQGSNYGYATGGNISNIIDKFSFTSDGNATDVGDLTDTYNNVAGQSSTASGYTSGGYSPGPTAPPLYQVSNIEKFPFSSDTNSSDIANLTSARYAAAGQSSDASGYTSGGQIWSSTARNIIDKFPFSSDANATDVGDITVARTSVSGQSSTASGYTSGGSPGTNVIDKFSFSSDANATDVGDLTVARGQTTGHNSSSYGYATGGFNPGLSPMRTNVIEKFPFSSDANSTDVGDLTSERNASAGTSSTASGYVSGGFPGTPPVVNIIEKFSFSADANATDVGDLTVARSSAGGQQY